MTFGPGAFGNAATYHCIFQAITLNPIMRSAVMKAMVCEAFGGPEVLAWRDVPDPAPPGPGEIQVRIGARGVQYVDVLMLAGKYQFRPDPPFIPGGEAAGEVIVVGPDVTNFKIGDRVMSRHTLGACAELGNAKAALCDLVPDGMSLEAARACSAAPIRPPITRCCSADGWRRANGCWSHGKPPAGIGIAAIQVAKLFGAHVIATASGAAKHAACLEEGAEHAIEYAGGFINKVKEITGGRGVDIVYDPIGANVADESLRCLAWGGRLLILGFLGGGPTNIRSNYLLIKGIDAIGVRIRWPE